MDQKELDLLVAAGNIAHFEKLLGSEIDELKCKTIRELLAREILKRDALLADNCRIMPPYPANGTR